MQEILIFIGGLSLGVILCFLFLSKQKKGLIPKESLHNLEEQLSLKETVLEEKNSRIEQLVGKETRLEQQLSDLQNRYEERKKDLEDLQSKFKAEFKNLAEEILEEKSKKFKTENKESLDAILSPFKEKLKSFEQKVEDTHKEGIRERSSLSEQIKTLAETNLQMQEDAKNLTAALKGDSKTQGDWGEDLLQRILEKAGLQKGYHFDSQATFKNEDGSSARPDYIIYLPDDRQLIVDSKVSLTHYTRYHEEEDETKKAAALKGHLLSMWNHVKSLREANYDSIKDIKSPDYVLMYVPIESAFNIVLKEKPNFFIEALEKNVVVVTGSTLLATMQTVSYIWKQDSLKKNIQEIAVAGGKLHDKVVTYIETFEKLGNQLGTAQKTYETAQKQLHTGSGNMVRTAEKLKKMGANVSANKVIPEKYLEDDSED